MTTGWMSCMLLQKGLNSWDILVLVLVLSQYSFHSTTSNHICSHQPCQDPWLYVTSLFLFLLMHSPHFPPTVYLLFFKSVLHFISSKLFLTHLVLFNAISQALPMEILLLSEVSPSGYSSTTLLPARALPRSYPHWGLSTTFLPGILKPP